MTSTIEQLAQQLGEELRKREWKLVTAESCTAGGLAYAITAIPGSSTWFDRGFITYSNLSKEELVRVSASTLKQYGAVSEQTAKEMAQGALEQSQAQVSMAITGIAGPDGGTPDKPVGTVWFAWAGINKKMDCCSQNFSGNRNQIREKSIEFALKQLLDYAKFNN
jgi:nicotinamide-nucleotide amidase